LEEAITEHPGQIYLQVRYYPLTTHKNALKAALYAECASRQKGKFWKFHEALLKNQKDWAMDDYPAIEFATYAASAGLNVSWLDACSHDPETQKAVLEEKKKGEELGVQITPSFFINGKLVVGIDNLIRELKTYFEEKKS
jgi:protein-disulfide isomerase